MPLSACTIASARPASLYTHATASRRASILATSHKGCWIQWRSSRLPIGVRVWSRRFKSVAAVTPPRSGSNNSRLPMVSSSSDMNAVDVARRTPTTCGMAPPRMVDGAWPMRAPAVTYRA